MCCCVQHVCIRSALCVLHWNSLPVLHWECWGLLRTMSECSLNAHWQFCSATSKKPDGKCISKKVIKQTHPYPIMPYALFVLNRKFLISLYPSNSFIPPNSGRMTRPERCERHFLISVTHTTLHFGFFFKRTVTRQRTQDRGTTSPQ